MDEQRIREIVREEITKEKEATTVTTPDEMKKIMLEVTGLSSNVTAVGAAAKLCIPCNITFDEPHPDDRYCPYCASELTEKQ